MKNKAIIKHLYFYLPFLFVLFVLTVSCNDEIAKEELVELYCGEWVNEERLEYPRYIYNEDGTGGVYHIIDEKEPFKVCRYFIIDAWRDNESNTFYRVVSNWDTSPWDNVGPAKYINLVKISKNGEVRESIGYRYKYPGLFDPETDTDKSFWKDLTIEKLTPSTESYSILYSKRDSSKQKEDVHKILFIGNSLTSYNDMPEQVATICNTIEGAPKIVCEKSTFPGVGLLHHVSPEYSDTLKMIRSNEYRTIVIQGHSSEPLKEYEHFLNHVKTLASTTQENGAEVYFFETWASNPEGYWIQQENFYEQVWTGGSYQKMQELVFHTYTKIAEECSAEVVPIGEAWKSFLEEYPAIYLYSEEGIHPTVSGSYLTACVFVRTLVGADPRQTNWIPAEISITEAKELQSAAMIIDEIE